MAARRLEDIPSAVFRPLAGLSGRAAGRALRPLAAPVRASTHTGARLARRTADRVLEGEELERAVASALNDVRLQLMFRRTLDSEGAARLIETFFDSGLFDTFVSRLLASDGLWRLVDEVASSPAVTAAVSQQGLRFADQVGGDVRARSRIADDWLERTARRLTHARSNRLPPPDGTTDP